MKTITFLLLSLLSVGHSYAKMPHWSVVRIATPSRSASLTPIQLSFADTLHGMLIVATDSLVSDKFSPEYGRAHDTVYYYSTDDGGRSWTQIYDTLLIPYPGTGSILFSSMNQQLLTPSVNVRYWNLLYPFYRPAGCEGHSLLLRSSDAGKSWHPLANEYSYSSNRKLVTAFSDNNILIYDDSLNLLYSYDGGKTFRNTTKDSVYKNLIHNKAGDFSFDFSDNLHWTVTVNKLGDNTTSGELFGLQTLTSSDFGYTWHSSITKIPGETNSNRISGTLQFIKRTPVLYYFTTPNSEGSVDQLNTWNDRYEDNSHPIFGINWLYSTDYGKTWSIQNTYGRTRRAFEATRDGEVWITAQKSVDTTRHLPAYIIARTTDNGEHWEEDSTTLLIESEHIDGRILTFKDPGHGWIAAVGGQSADASIGASIFIYRYNKFLQPSSAPSASDEYDIRHRFLRIYPNPGTSEIRWSVYSAFMAQDISLYDMIGRRVSVPVHFDANTATVDVSKIPSACYLSVFTYSYNGSVAKLSLPVIVQH